MFRYKKLFTNVYFVFCTLVAKNDNYKWKIFFENCSIKTLTVKGNLYRKKPLCTMKKLKIRYTKTQSKQTIGWLVFTIWIVCKRICKLNVLLQIRFTGTGAFYKAYQLLYGRGKWKIQDMINHFKTSYWLSKPNKPMVNNVFLKKELSYAYADTNKNWSTEKKSLNPNYWSLNL